MNKVYRSKVDTWLGLILGGTPVVLVFVAWKLVHAPVPGRWLLVIPVVLLGVCLPLSILIATTYRITDEFLVIRSGLLKWKISLREISHVAPTNEPTSGPALSMDRIRIEYGPRKSVLVSPVNKEEFLHDLRTLGVPRA